MFGGRFSTARAGIDFHVHPPGCVTSLRSGKRRGHVASLVEKSRKVSLIVRLLQSFLTNLLMPMTFDSGSLDFNWVG